MLISHWSITLQQGLVLKILELLKRLSVMISLVKYEAIVKCVII